MVVPDLTQFAPNDPHYRQDIVGPFPPEPERARLQAQADSKWPHLRPDSVLIACIGNHWAPGSWQRVADMMMETNKQGYACWLAEIQNRCFNPLDALGTMRNEAWLQAANPGTEWGPHWQNEPP